MELDILNFIQTLRNPILDTFFVFYTTIGNHGEIWLVIMGVLLYFKKTRKIALLGLIAIACELLLVNGILKNVFQRPRPFVVNPDIILMIKEPSGYSFPSGHAASSFAVAWTLFLANIPYRKTILGLAALMALSRLYVYVHFPSDILVGALVGMLVGTCVIKLAPKKWYQPLPSKRSQSVGL